MADDRQLLIGKWTVWVKTWIWEYEFFADGRVHWRDTKSLEKGTGRWAMSPTLVNLSWDNSATKESWRRPLNTSRNQQTFCNSSYFTGPYQIEKKVVAAASDLPVGLNPAIAQVPWEKYVDQFVTCKYDLNYKIPSNVSFGYSSILQLSYGDGVSLELDFDEIQEISLASQTVRDSMAQAYRGRSSRIFPKVLAPATVPRLWLAKSKALADQDADFNAFAGTAMAGVAFVLGVPAMPAGLPPAAGVVVGKSRVPGVSRTAGVALSEAEQTAINAIRQHPEFARLSVEEVAAIRSYSGNNWDKINLFLRGGGGSAQTQAEAKALVSGLQKLPGYGGKLVRSESGTIADILQRYPKGKEFKPQGMLSASRGGAVAQREGNVAITIQATGKSGKDISKAAVHGTGGGSKESEVLFPPGTRFLVESVTQLGQAFVVVLREL